MKTMPGGEVVAQSLVANGIDTLFAIPGVQLDPIFAALHDVQDKIRIIHARHEQGVALMAFGYAHVTRKVATLLVVPGPGFLNATTGMLTAHACNAPLLCLVGQSERLFIGSGVGVLHELENQIGIARSLSKWAERVEEPETISSTIAEALTAIRHHRSRPAYVELPSDIVRMDVQIEELSVASEELVLPAIDADLIQRTAKALASAKAPLIMAGGGATHARESIQRLAELLGAPVGMSENGLGTLNCRHPLAFTQTGANKLWGRADVVLALGTRLYAPIFNWGWDDDLQIFKVDIDDSELNRLPAPVQGIHGEVDQVVNLICEGLEKYITAPVADRAVEFEKIREEVSESLSSLGLHRELLEIIRQEIGESGILVSDVTQLNHACMDMFPVHDARTYVSSGYQGTLGFGPCTAMGMKVGKPDVVVVCLVGDGGFMYAAQELATAVQFNIPVIMLVMNDGAYKNVEGILNRSYDGRAVATTLQNPDFLKFADSFGVAARRVSTPAEMRTALRELIKENVPAVIDYTVSDFPSAFWLRFLPQVRKNIPENKYSLIKK